MSMTPADPPLPKSSPAPDRSPTPEWTTSREVALDCAGCGARFMLKYKYRFVEGLAATRVRCPTPGCGRGREYYLPVNAFDVAVAPAPRTTPDAR
jgi:hypothetical protein